MGADPAQSELEDERLRKGWGSFKERRLDLGMISVYNWGISSLPLIGQSMTCLAWHSHSSHR